MRKGGLGDIIFPRSFHGGYVLVWLQELLEERAALGKPAFPVTKLYQYNGKTTANTTKYVHETCTPYSTLRYRFWTLAMTTCEYNVLWKET